MLNQANNPMQQNVNDEPGFQSINGRYASAFCPNRIDTAGGSPHVKNHPYSRFHRRYRSRSSENFVTTRPPHPAPRREH